MNIQFDIDKTRERKCKLDKLYADVFCDNGKCKYLKYCSKNMETRFGYDSSRCVKLGKYYDLKIDGNDVRIVFIGKEGPNYQKEIGRPAKLSESTDDSGTKVTQHWLTSYKMLCDMFGSSYKPMSGRYIDQPAMCLQAFALSNRYRCAYKNYQNQRQGIPNNDNQNINCKKILIEELKILEPTIIVLQISDLKTGDLFEQTEKIGEGNTLYKTSINTQTCYVIETYHPSWRCKEGNWWKLKYPEFKNNIKYLKQINVLPEGLEICKYLDSNITPDNI